MLIICNGTFKSGSSWMHAIIIEILKLKTVNISEIPNIYNPNTQSPTRILEKNLNSFIKEQDIISKTYVTKSHYFQPKTLSFSYPESVVFLFVERELKDAIVSHYFHFRNYRLKSISFSLYFWVIGIFKAYEMCLFNERSKKNFSQEYFFTFEGFKNNFTTNVQKLCQILGVSDLSLHEIELVKEKTSLRHMKQESMLRKNKYYPELGEESHKLFRSGKIGEWKTIFSARQLSFANKIYLGNTSFFIRAGYFILFTWRRRIGL